MSAFDTYRMMRDSTLRNGENARAEQVQQNALLARQQAGGMIAGGDLSGGANALLGAGDIAGGMAVTNAGQAQQAANRERQQATLVAGASSLLRVPANQRPAFFSQRVAPILQQEGLGDYIAQITPDNMSDEELQGFVVALGGEVEDPRVLQGQRGAVDLYDPYTRTISNVRPAEQEQAPNGYRWGPDGALQAIPGGPADPRVVSTRAAAGRAPPRARSSGGGGSRAGGSAPAAAPSRKPWERF